MSEPKCFNFFKNCPCSSSNLQKWFQAFLASFRPDISNSSSKIPHIPCQRTEKTKVTIVNLCFITYFTLSNNQSRTKPYPDPDKAVLWFATSLIIANNSIMKTLLNLYNSQKESVLCLIFWKCDNDHCETMSIQYYFGSIQNYWK